MCEMVVEIATRLITLGRMFAIHRSLLSNAVIQNHLCTRFSGIGCSSMPRRGKAES